MSLNLDFGREARQGFPEVVFGEGKSLDQLTEICTQYQKSGTPMLVTRVREDQQELLKAAFEKGGEYRSEARAFLWLPEGKKQQQSTSKACLICAGSSDIPVLAEAEVTLEFLGARTERICDVGVAGIHRILNQKDALKSADVCIVIAGMDGALPSVVGGLAACPVIAVPTSVGYGASFGGLAALLTMLNSCASGISVVNIDNGYGAAMAAWRIIRKLG